MINPLDTREQMASLRLARNPTGNLNSPSYQRNYDYRLLSRLPSVTRRRTDHKITNTNKRAAQDGTKYLICYISL
jgi:hypothetical protein